MGCSAVRWGKLGEVEWDVVGDVLMYIMMKIYIYLFF